MDDGARSELVDGHGSVQLEPEVDGNGNVQLEVDLGEEGRTWRGSRQPGTGLPPWATWATMLPWATGNPTTMEVWPALCPFSGVVMYNVKVKVQ